MDKVGLNEFSLLYQLGVTANYLGFKQTAYAVRLCVEEPERLLFVTKWVYPDVARRYHTNWRAVERNIRTVNHIIWRENRAYLEKLAQRPLSRKPYAGQLLAILSSALLVDDPEEHVSDENSKIFSPIAKTTYGQ